MKLITFPEHKKIKPIEFELWFRILIMENFLKTITNLAEEIFRDRKYHTRSREKKGD